MKASLKTGILQENTILFQAPKGKEVVLNISATLSDGTTLRDKQTIRTKDIPPAVMLVNGKEAPRSMSKDCFE